MYNVTVVVVVVVSHNCRMTFYLFNCVIRATRFNTYVSKTMYYNRNRVLLLLYIFFAYSLHVLWVGYFSLQICTEKKHFSIADDYENIYLMAMRVKSVSVYYNIILLYCLLLCQKIRKILFFFIKLFKIDFRQ